MCSVSWWWNEENSSLRVIFNRDERKTRQLAAPPEVYDLDGLQVLMPIDTERGGTWLASNKKGITVALLNNYTVSLDPEKKYDSRGSLVKSIVAQSQLASAISVLKEHVYTLTLPAFTLFIWDHSTQTTKSFAWDEATLNEVELESCFYTSSSWNTSEVQIFRHQLFDELVIQGEMNASDFHRLETDGKQAWLPYMQRELTQTVSITEVTIDQKNVQMDYFDRNTQECFSQLLAR